MGKPLPRIIFNGVNLKVSAVLIDAEAVNNLIKALLVLKSVLPKSAEH